MDLFSSTCSNCLLKLKKIKLFKTKPTCPCCKKDSGCLPQPVEDNRVQNLIEIDDYLLYCQNVNGSCTIVNKNDLETSKPVLTQSELVSQIPENPAMVSILEISDSQNVKHKVIYSARTNTYGSAKCITDYKCISNSITTSKNEMKTVLVNFEIPPEKLKGGDRFWENYG